MPVIEAFRGLRYDLGHVGNLSDVIAPPYDVISPELQEELYKQHPANTVRLILNREEPGDDDASNRYTRAAKFLRNWQEEGVLFRDPDPVVYVYHQEYTYAGQSYLRKGFMARLKLEPFGKGNIFPHEITMPGPKKDRLLLTRHCQANLSQIFGIYPDDASAAQSVLEQSIAGQQPVQATDHLGVIHRIWPVSDISTITELGTKMADKPLFIADGHHRYETALAYREECTEAASDPRDPANFVLAMCTSMSDPGMIVLPTHRLLPNLPELSSQDMASRLGDWFELTPRGKGVSSAGQVWEEIATEDHQTLMGLYAGQDQQWLLARLRPEGEAEMQRVAADHSDTWQGLGVAVLHSLALPKLYAGQEVPKPKYVHLVEEVEAGLSSGGFPAAALVMPATLEHVRQISEEGERMPAKSTYFYPKLASGLIFNPLA